MRIRSSNRSNVNISKRINRSSADRSKAVPLLQFVFVHALTVSYVAFVFVIVCSSLLLLVSRECPAS